MEHKSEGSNSFQYQKVSLWFALIIFILLALMLVYQNYFYAMQTGPAQPIAFSHRVHAGNKQIGCFMCHDTAPVSASAGFPALETCMLCHQTILINHPEVEKLREHYFRKKTVEWIRVFTLPDFVYFDHSVHLIKNVDCGKCHGNIKAMDRVFEPRKMTMGFCIDCHRENNVTTDCFTCHR